MKSQAQGGNAKESEPGRNNPSGNGSGFTTARKSQIVAIEPSGSQRQADRKATGPRTEQGKQRSSRNAIKHGVFSKVVVLKDESRAEFEALLAGLREALQPEGALEELLVEKLATTAWRHRRLLLAEGAEIRKNMEFVEWDQQNREREAMPESSLFGLIHKIHKPGTLERCLELLSSLSEQIKEEGFDRENDTAVLERIYGGPSRDNLYYSYVIWLDTSETPEEERVREGYALPEQCRKNVVEEIEKEIQRLKRYKKARASVETSRTQLEILRHSVPDAPGLDRLLRYEASLERSFDRTLSQLERLQRMRLGLPVPHRVEVQHTVSQG